MSRYTQVNGNIESVIGWDDPLQTFFLIQTDTSTVDYEDIICWKGVRASEISTIEDLKVLCSEYRVDISKEMEEQLVADSLVPHQPSALQQWVMNSGLLNK